MASINLQGDTSGSISISAPSVAGNNTLTLPATSQTLATQNALGVRNLIINGDMRIDQRNAGSAVTPANGDYTIDRWRATLTQSSKYSVQQSTDAPSGFTNSALITSLSAYTVLSTDYFLYQQRIEGNNVSHISYGNSDAKTLTLSFWVKSSLTGTFSGCLWHTGPYSYPFTYTISSANTWEYKTITIIGDTVNAISTDNTTGLTLYMSLGTGSNYHGTANAWASGNYFGVSGENPIVSTNGATWQITGVQLEISDGEATPFEHRPYDMELARCQRYYYRNSADSNYMSYASGRANSTTAGVFTYYHPVTMRALPTYTQSGTGINTPSQLTATGFGSIYAGKNSSFVGVNVASGLTAGNGLLWNSNNNTTSYVEASAEL